MTNSPKSSTHEEPNIAPAATGKTAPKTLDELLDHVEQHVRVTLHQTGAVEPAFIILAANGSLLLFPADTSDDEAKDKSVLVARLASIGYAATAVVFASEAWASCNPDSTIQPSQSSDREEILLLHGEDREGCKQRILPIFRTNCGDFSGVVAEYSEQPQCFQGRFTNILCPIPPSPQLQSIARETLIRLGVTPEKTSG